MSIESRPGTPRTSPPPTQHAVEIKQAAILFAGGPAPAANAVISAVADSFLRKGIGVIGIKYGYSSLVQYPERDLKEGRDYMSIAQTQLSRTRNSQGIMIGTARDNPGEKVTHPSHLGDPILADKLRRVYEGLCSLNVNALVSIGGDDTLKTANKLKLYQDRLPDDSPRIPIVHLPKTIDNDYHGIDFTFGFFTAVQTLAEEIRNLIHDAAASRSYFLTETMGRSAGWLAYGAAMAGEACMVLSVEDIVGSLETVETWVDPKTEERFDRKIMNLPEIIKRIVKMMRTRDDAGKEFGVIVVAEGLAEYLPQEHLQNVPRDAHGHLAIGDVDLGRLLARLVAEEYRKQTSKNRKVTGLQLGYESRCAKPHAFDVLLGSQLGVGAYRALVERKFTGVMVSVYGQLELHYEPFENLVDPETLVTHVRYIKHGSDFHRLARFLETHVNQ